MHGYNKDHMNSLLFKFHSKCLPDHCTHELLYYVKSRNCVMILISLDHLQSAQNMVPPTCHNVQPCDDSY